MSIKLLGIDIDGTLLNSSFQISPENHEAIRRVKALGIIVVLLTGRRFRSAAPLARQLGIDDPIAVNNGALIKRPANGDLLRAVLLPAAECRDVIAIARELYMDPVVTIDAQGHGQMVLDRLDQQNVQMVRYLSLSSQDVQTVEDLLAFIQNDPVQVTFSHHPERINPLSDALARRMGPRVKLLNTVYPQRDLSILDVIHPQVSKGAGLAAIGDMCGIRQAETMAIGDNFNDLDMLRYAGTAVVMGNAEPALKAHGFPVTASNDHHGVAVAIEEYILTKS
ncbi:MAG: HAD family phosphatase [Acidobacteria bacterium]|nr:HAD family phosphatase [Acidobacteriota bacterium]MBI3657778.1 HAD family phosphatase [Acidobacteriota bacterium]